MTVFAQEILKKNVSPHFTCGKTPLFRPLKLVCSSPLLLRQTKPLIDNLSEADEEKLGAILECESCRSISDVAELIEQLDSYDLLCGIEDDEALGYYFADELCCLEIPENIKFYFDYEAYGRDIRLEGNITYTSYGCLLDNR